MEIPTFIFFCVCGLFFSTGGMLGSFAADNSIDIQQLGNAICDQEYNLEFDSYSKGELKCKQPEQTEAYDGIVINIGNKEDN